MAIRFDDRDHDYTNAPQAPVGSSSDNVGPTWKIVSKILNRIPLITGLTNWWDTPATPLSGKADKAGDTFTGIVNTKAADSYPLRVTNTGNTGTFPYAGTARVGFYDNDGDRIGSVGINGDGGFNLDSQQGGASYFAWDAANSVYRTVYHTGNHGRIYSTKQVRAATTANITLSGTQTVDGVALVAADRALVKNQTTASQNGIYDVVSGGAWTRVADMDESAEAFNGLLVTVAEGTTNVGLWRLSTSDPITLGTTALTFTAVVASGAVTGHNFWSSSHPDVDATDTPANGDVVTYQSSNSKWVASPAATYPQDTIQGLELTWDSATTLGVEVGSAYVQSVGGLVTLSSRATLTFSGMTTGAIQYIYLTNSGTIVSSTTAPTTPYYGVNARSMTADTTRRYIGEVIAASATTIHPFRYMPKMGLVEYLGNIGAAPFVVLSDGVATTETTISMATVIPTTSRLAHVQFKHVTSGIPVVIGSADDNFTLSATTPAYLRMMRSASSNNVQMESLVPITSSQTITYTYASAPTAGNGLYVYIQGYLVQR